MTRCEVASYLQRLELSRIYREAAYEPVSQAHPAEVVADKQILDFMVTPRGVNFNSLDLLRLSANVIFMVGPEVIPSA
jgi:hypothetical protein